MNYRKYYTSLEPILAKPKTKIYSTVIFCFLAVSLFGWYAIRPTVQTILYLRREINDKTDVNKKMDEKINALIQSQAILEQEVDRLPVLRDVVPANPNAVDITRQLQSIASSYGATVSALQISSVPILTSSQSSQIALVKHTAFPITLTVEGSYPSILEFLKSVVGMRRITTITSLAFTPKKLGGEGSTGMLQVVAKLSSFYSGQQL